MAGTIQQIAEIAGVSRGTVDRALNYRGRISPEVAEKIWKIADEIGYVPKSKRKQNEKKEEVHKIKIGVVTQLSGSSFMIEVNRGIENAKQELLERGIEVIVKENESVDQEEQIKALNLLEEEGVEGIALMPVECNQVREKIQNLIEEKNMPIITFNSDIVGTKRKCYIGLDNRQSGKTAAGLMGLMTKGKGKILVITGFFTNSVNSLRVEGFVEELKESFPELELVGVQSSSDSTDEVERIVENTITIFPELSGIFVASGGQAGVGRAFIKLGLEKRPYVIIYDLTPKNEKALKENTVDFLIDQEGYEQGYRSLYMLSDMLQKRQETEIEYQYTEIRIKTKYNI